MNAPDTHAQLLAALAHSWAHTDEILAAAQPDAMYERPIAARHRLIFYVGHLEAFDWNLLRAACGRAAFAADLDALFAFGIDPQNDALPRDRACEWPDMPSVRRYRQQIRDRLGLALAQAAPSRGLHHLLNLCIEHRLMHGETLCYMLHQLPCDRLVTPAPQPAPDRPEVVRRWCSVPRGRVRMGRHRDEGFGWDNEFDGHDVEVDAFRIESHPVTHADFLAFIDAGGYDREALWRPEDWAWRQAQRVEHPRLWRRAPGGGWRYRTMFAEIDLPTAWPVYVSFAEAAAYVRWRGLQLPNEAQWQRAAYGSDSGASRAFPWGDAPPGAGRGNFAGQSWTPAPVDAHDGSCSDFGVADLVGNGWEWTRSHLRPFPGFVADPEYRGYSDDFFDDRHFVLKGGSARTATPLLRASFRNWFQPHYPFVYATFRCVAAG